MMPTGMFYNLTNHWLLILSYIRFITSEFLCVGFVWWDGNSKSYYWVANLGFFINTTEPYKVIAYQVIFSLWYIRRQTINIL